MIAYRALRSLFALLLLPLTAAAQVRNGGLERRGANPPYFTQETVTKLRAGGWTCPDVDQWPWWWSAGGRNVVLDWPPTGGHSGGYGRIRGAGGYVAGYHGYELKTDQVLTVWARGKGTLTAGFLGYERTPDGGTRGRGNPPSLTVAIDGEHWMRYRHLLRLADNPGLYAVHVMIAAPAGVVDFDDVELVPASAADVLLVEAETRLRAQGGLIAAAEVVAADAAFRARVGLYRQALAEFAGAGDKVAAPLREELGAAAKALDPYVLGDDKTVVQALHYNDMLILTHALQSLAGAAAVTSAPAVSAVTAGAAAVPLPGVRPARPDTVTITDIRSDKVRYDENETATTRATLRNTSAGEVAGTLIAEMIVDVDTRREVARGAFSVPAGATRTWEFSYPVGPETYGRALEVHYVTAAGQVADSWQEYYSVAAEWFRVQQHILPNPMKTYDAESPWVTYHNQVHDYASEPTDWGVQVALVKDLEEYLSGQPLYHLNLPARRARHAAGRRLGISSTFYQTFSYAGQMGYEVLRQHPEFALYDANGQFAVDPIYGGYPNPFELASPVEIGPQRKVSKPYLDRRISSWQHGVMNYAREEVVRYMAECIREYAAFLNCDGVYVDGNVGVYRGYGADGRRNVPSGKYEDYVDLNARNHRLFSEILKQDNPNFGTWFNWTAGASVYYGSQGHINYHGTGGSEFDPRDDAIRAAAGWQNVMLLDETPRQFTGDDADYCYPDRHLRNLCDNRDYLVQRIGANLIQGYIGNFSGIEQESPPGPDRWGWAATNYLGAQHLATQYHVVSWFLPSWRPTLQFMTRYSRFLWARDIRVVPNAEKRVSVTGTDQVWWQRLVYRRDTADGYDLIVHLVRIPPFGKWDLKWLEEPKPLDRVRLTVSTGPATLRDVQAMRPYYFDEPQQPVQRRVEAAGDGGLVEFTVPEFRYHTMVVLRFGEGN
jgi:hypothetical protein